MPAFLFVLVVIALSGCERQPDIEEFGGSAMGTSWSVQMYGLPAGVSRSQMQGDFEQLLDLVDRQMSIYRDDSYITRFNRAGPGETLVIPPDFNQVLTTALELAKASGGAFDPTVGPLVELWGFGGEGASSEPPPREEIEALREKVGWERLEFDSASGELTQPGDIYLDVAAVAKGHAVDRLADLLDARGVSSYLVSIGGDMRIRGRKADGEPWRVGIERPTAGSRDIHRVVAPRDIAMTSSGDYRNFFEYDGRRYAHIIDARTGYPVEHELASVSVLHERARKADGLATMLTVLGAEEARVFAEERDLAVFLIERTEDGYREWESPAFSEHLYEVAD